MFSMEVVATDHFLEMPSTARLLYYDLGMRADDDGFVSPRRVIRETNANEDDLKVLLAKKFLYAFEDGVIVILHWKRNNTLKNDRYLPSIYKKRLNKLGVKYLPGAKGSGSRVDPQKSIGEYSKEISKEEKQKAANVLADHLSRKHNLTRIDVGWSKV